MNRLIGALALALACLLSTSDCFASRTASFTVTVTIPEYPLMATVLPGCEFVFGGGEEVVECTAELLLAQPTLETDGWRLELSIDDVRDINTTSALPSSAVALKSYGELIVSYGQAVDPSGGPFLANTALFQSMDMPRTVVAADPGYGNGVYRAEVQLRLTVPANTAPGTYVPTFTIGVSNNSI
jgi:hypothetical protein